VGRCSSLKGASRDDRLIPRGETDMIKYWFERYKRNRADRAWMAAVARGYRPLP